MIQRILNNPIGRALIIYLIMLFVLILFVVLLQPVLFPLVASFILFSILDPFKNRLLRQGMNSTAAILVVLLGVITFGILCLALGVPLMLDQWEWLQSRLPVIAAQIAKLMDMFGGSLVHMSGMQMDTSLGDRWQADVKNWSADAVVSSAGIMMTSAMSLVLIPLITFFLLRDYRKMRNTLIDWLPNSAYELGWLIYFRVAKRLQRYIRSVALQSCIVAVVTTTGFYLIGLDTSVLFGSLAGLLNLIPYIGPLLSLVPPMLATLGTGSLDIFMMLSILLVIMSAQIIDNVIVIPNLIAHTVDLHPMLVLLGVVVFGYLFGFVGMLIAIPLLTSSKIILTGLINGLRKKLTEDVLYILPKPEENQA
ncbi:MAG: AI-2E family transporter [Gammaproteobacteria bacterium]|nr:AI-2E family transporter [Gammaproteobacteria bacterium]MDH5778390.1 AI-2E family transporter [Gammaproteobacteria bacterium]